MKILNNMQNKWKIFQKIQIIWYLYHGKIKKKELNLLKIQFIRRKKVVI